MTTLPAALNSEQRDALAAFVNTHTAYEAARSRRVEDLANRRLDALAEARRLGVPGTTLARAADLSHGRIYQLVEEYEARVQGWESVAARKRSHAVVDYPEGDWLTPEDLDVWLSEQPSNGNGHG